MQVNYKVIRWKNFLSTGDVFTEIRLDKALVTLIVGKNGSGKSTLLDAIMFALYGKPYRNINKPMLVNSVNKKDMVVEIEFDANGKEYKVVRGIKPDIFNIIENGVILDQAASIIDHQEKLQSIIKKDIKSFRQIEVLGSANFIPFMQLPAADRRAVIEDILDLQVFAKMNLLLKEEISANKEKLKDITSEISLLETKIDVHSNNIKRNAKLKEEVNKDAQKDLKKYGDDKQKNISLISKLNEKIENLKKEIISNDKIASKLKELGDIKQKLNSSLSKTNKEKEFFIHNDTCPVCKQDIDETFKKGSINSKQEKSEKIEHNISLLLQTKEKIEEKFKNGEVLNKQLRALESELIDCKNNIKYCDNMLSYVSTSIEEKAVDDNYDLEQIQKLNGSIDAKVKEKEQTIIDRNTLDVSIQVLNSFKLQKIKQYVKIINKFVNKYLSSMEFFVSFELNESFEEKIKSRHRDTFGYNSFSEGEKQRINLALLFTWRAVSKLRNKASSNLLIMDEIFDSSTDAEGVENLMKIIKEFSDTNIFIISHNSQLKDSFSKSIVFEKVKGFSRIGS